MAVRSSSADWSHLESWKADDESNSIQAYIAVDVDGGRLVFVFNRPLALD